MEVHTVTAPSVAEGLVSTATETGGLLIIGATRTRELKRWVFGSTPDRVIDPADDACVLVLVYAGSTGLPQRIGERLFPLYRYYKRLTTQRRPTSEQRPTDQ